MHARARDSSFQACYVGLHTLKHPRISVPHHGVSLSIPQLVFQVESHPVSRGHTEQGMFSQVAAHRGVQMLSSIQLRPHTRCVHSTILIYLLHNVLDGTPLESQELCAVMFVLVNWAMDPLHCSNFIRDVLTLVVSGSSDSLYIEYDKFLLLQHGVRIGRQESLFFFH